MSCITDELVKPGLWALLLNVLHLYYAKRCITVSRRDPHCRFTPISVSGQKPRYSRVLVRGRFTVYTLQRVTKKTQTVLFSFFFLLEGGNDKMNKAIFTFLIQKSNWWEKIKISETVKSLLLTVTLSLLTLLTMTPQTSNG